MICRMGECLQHDTGPRLTSVSKVILTSVGFNSSFKFYSSHLWFQSNGQKSKFYMGYTGPDRKFIWPIVHSNFIIFDPLRYYKHTTIVSKTVRRFTFLTVPFSSRVSLLIFHTVPVFLKVKKLPCHCSYPLDIHMCYVFHTPMRCNLRKRPWMLSLSCNLFMLSLSPYSLDESSTGGLKCDLLGGGASDIIAGILTISQTADRVRAPRKMSVAHYERMPKMSNFRLLG